MRGYQAFKMSVELETTTAEYWQERWRDNKIGWHNDYVDKFLMKYVDELTGGRSNLRVFVPLCGKSLDMLWLADQGHHVVGVEVAKKGIESFFEENKLTFTLEKITMAATVDPVDVYKCVEKQITIFCCDFFALTEKDVGKFDAVWDRGSLSTMLPAVGNRGKIYTKHMHSLLTTDARYLLESLQFKEDRGNRPPASISDELRNQIFEEYFIIRELEVERVEEDPNRHLSFAMSRNVHLFEPKTN